MSDDDPIRRGDAIDCVLSQVTQDPYATIEMVVIRAANSIRAIPTTPKKVKPLDLSYVQKHAFLAGVVAARNIPADHPCDGPLLWLDYDPGENPALNRIRSALTVQPSPDVAALVEYFRASEDIATIEAQWRQRKSEGLLDGSNIFHLTDKLTAAETRLSLARAALKGDTHD